MDTLQAEAVYEASQKPTAGCGKQPKLKPNQAKHLLELHDLGTYTQAELAELFGVGRSTIYRTLERMRPAPPESERPSHALRTLRLEKNNKSPSRDRAALRSGVLGVLIAGGSRTGGPLPSGSRRAPGAAEAFALQPLITAALWQDSPLRFDASDRMDADWEVRESHGVGIDPVTLVAIIAVPFSAFFVKFLEVAAVDSYKALKNWLRRLSAATHANLELRDPDIPQVIRLPRTERPCVC